jgi:TolB-like protein/tetratricopeptide (TPR) repeat protein/DNA-binding winged helix-turn-helix (wHTH) protein
VSADYLHGFYLSDLLVEPLKGQVTSKNDTRHLPPIAAEVLLCLARTPGELVTRQALLDEVWGEGNGSQEALSHAVSEIRQALDDHADDPAFVQTLRGRGYRLTVEPLSVEEHRESIVIGAQSSADLGLFENLSRRGVIETALAYLILGWLIIQVADIVFAQLHVPPWAGTFVTVLVISGFPIAIALSWFLEFRDGRAVPHEQSPAASRRRRFSRTYVSVVAALVVASALVYLYDQKVGLPTAVETPATPTVGMPDTIAVAENSIAVLPFFNVDGSNDTQVFATGLVDDVINRLARVPGLRVSSRGDSSTLEPNSASELVRRRLRVAMYLEGSVQIASDRIRVIVQLIDSADGFHVLSRTFDRPREDFFDIRDEVTNLTVSSLRVALPDETQAMSTAGSPHPDLDAYVLYRRGVDESRKPHSTTTAASALGWFDAALEVDPDYAAAYAGKCSTYTNSYQYTDDPDVMVDAELACARALELNPNLFVVHNALGGLYAQTGKYDQAEASYLESLRINPQNVPALTGLSDIYRVLQRADQAEETLLGAVGLEPGNWAVYNHLGYFYYRQGRYAEAAEQYAMVVSIDDTNMRGYGNLAVSHMMAGNFAAAAPTFERSIELEPQASAYSNLGLMRYYLGDYDGAALSLRSAIELAPNDHLYWSNLGDVLWVAGLKDGSEAAYREAQERATTALEVNPNDAAVMMDRAWIRAMLGNRDAALEEIGKASERLPDDPYADYIRTLIHNRYGDADSAIGALQQAVDKGYSVVILGTEPQLAALHSDPRFVAIVGAENIRN